LTPSLQDLLSGATPSVLRLHLTDSPLVEPYSLANLIEPSWAGYVAAIMELQQQSPQSTGWAWIVGTGGFTYTGESPAPLLSALFVTATYQGTEYLLCVVDLAESSFQKLPQGTTVFSVRVDAFVMMQG
jgi:hypothetical protein